MKRSEVRTAFFIAKKNIYRNRNSLLLTIFIISLGFISSIIIYGILQDVQYRIQENYIETSMGHIIIEPYEKGSKIENPSDIIKKINTLPGIKGIAKINKKAGQFYDSDGNKISSEIYIIDPEEYSSVSVVDNKIYNGEWLHEGETGKIFFGCVNIRSCNKIVAFDALNLNVGDKVYGVIDNVPVNFSIQGIYKHSLPEIEMISYITEDTAKKIFDNFNPDESDQILVVLSKREDYNYIYTELSKMQINAKILTWKEKSSKYSSVVDSFNIIGNISFIIGVIISAISIYIILYINILNKRTQIGIIRAMGIRSRVVSFSYVILSFYLGILGSIVGILLTLGMMQFFKFNPIHTGLGDVIPSATPAVFLVVSISIIFASVFSGYFVSKKIAKQNIIEAISHG